MLLLSGDGQIGTPYHIDTSDALSKSLIRVNPEMLEKQLPLFYLNLNTQLEQLSFLKFNS